MNVQTHLSLLGKHVRDKVTGAAGIAESVCFDLYGCIQVSINGGFDKEGKRKDSYWFDVSRLTVEDDNPVMDPPNFAFGAVAEGNHGCAVHPTQRA